MNLFGRKAPAPTPSGPESTAATIMKLREQVDTLEKREAHIEKKIQQQIQDAVRKSAAKDKKGAIFCLKRKKMYEGELQKLGGAKMTLETQVLALEQSQVNMDTYKALRAGANHMKILHQQMDVDAVDSTMDDIQEEMATADEIGRAISQPLGGEVYDEDELEAELQEMEELELEAQLQKPMATPAAPLRQVVAPATPVAVPHMPVAPSHTIPSSVRVEGHTDEEELEALRKLEASMAL